MQYIDGGVGCMYLYLYLYLCLCLCLCRKQAQCQGKPERKRTAGANKGFHFISFCNFTLQAANRACIGVVWRLHWALQNVSGMVWEIVINSIKSMAYAM